MAFKPVLAHASCVFDIAGFGENDVIGLQSYRIRWNNAK